MQVCIAPMLSQHNTGKRRRRVQEARQSLTIYRRYNSHTGVRFTDVPAPVPQPRSALAPDFYPWQNSLRGIRRTYEAFRKYSKDSRIEFVRNAPLIGDYKIVYTEDGVNKEIYVEYKIAHCRVSGRSEKILVHHQAALGHTNRCIFTWKAKWDYIFTQIDSDQALLIPRDEIPREWWNAAITKGGGFQLK